MNQSIDIIHKWLKEVIIGLNICPFARIPFENNRINITLSKISDIEKTLQEQIVLINKQKFDTSLIATQDNISFHELLSLCDYLSEIYNRDNNFQFIAFHPEFVFEGVDSNSRANLVNRSPLALIHILKNSELDNLLSTDQAKNMSINNEKFLNSLSQDELKKYFNYLNLDAFRL